MALCARLKCSPTPEVTLLADRRTQGRRAWLEVEKGRPASGTIRRGDGSSRTFPESSACACARRKASGSKPRVEEDGVQVSKSQRRQIDVEKGMVSHADDQVSRSTLSGQDYGSTVRGIGPDCDAVLASYRARRLHDAEPRGTKSICWYRNVVRPLRSIFYGVLGLSSVLSVHSSITCWRNGSEVFSCTAVKRYANEYWTKV